MKKEWLVKTLAFGIVVLFIGTGVVSGFKIADKSNVTNDNHPPNTPYNEHPINNTIGVPINTNLSWKCNDPDPGDTLIYDVYLEAKDPTPDTKVADNISETTFNPGILEFGTSYWWQVIAKDNHGAMTEGRIWHFTTLGTVLIIDGPTHGLVGEPLTYSFLLIYLEGCDIYYYVEWGDDTNTGWFGPFSSGEVVFKTHTWTEIGNYTIMAEAKGCNGSQYYATLNVTITENHPPNAPEIRGPMNFIPKKLYNYTFNATDPDGDNVSYEIDWGDGTSEKWIGPYASGEEIIQSHTYFMTHTTLIKARAKDTQGAIGEWGYLIPDSKNKQLINPAFLQFLEQHHYAFPILKYVLGRR